MLTDNETKDLLKETEALMEGHFVLSSGLRSDKYVQCAKLLMHPQKAERICKSLAEKVKKSKIVKIRGRKKPKVKHWGVVGRGPVCIRNFQCITSGTPGDHY